MSRSKAKRRSLRVKVHGLKFNHSEPFYFDLRSPRNPGVCEFCGKTLFPPFSSVKETSRALSLDCLPMIAAAVCHAAAKMCSAATGMHSTGAVSAAAVPAAAIVPSTTAVASTIPGTRRRSISSRSRMPGRRRIPPRSKLPGIGIISLVTLWGRPVPHLRISGPATRPVGHTRIRTIPGSARH